ncbi:MAG: ABC transporter permease [Fuerstiella sp.]|nr:ABC transporter permease [Fuerstiella sp.]
MNNPILQRELVGILRTRRAFALQVSIAVLFALLVLLRWPTDALVDLSGTQSRQVFRLFGYGLLATLILLVPVFPATSIVRERISGTLALLINSLMSPWKIYIGKLAGVLVFALMMLVMSLPAAVACYAMGGVDLVTGVLALYGILMLVAIQYATLGLFVSSRAASSDSALRITYGLVLFTTVVVLGPHLFLQGQPGWLSDFAFWLQCISPVPAVMELLGQGDVGSQGVISRATTSWGYVVSSAVITAAYVWATVTRLNSSMLDRARSSGAITDDQSHSTQLMRRLMFLVDPQRRKSSIGKWTNPVMVKEFRCRRFGRSHWMIRMVSGCTILSLALSILTTTGTMDWSVETIGGILVVMQVAIIVLVTPSLSVGVISAERESGGWRMLMVTPLSAGTILRGKLLSVIWPVLLLLLATLPGYAVMMYIDPGLRLQIQQVIICLLVTAGFVLVLSATISSLFDRTASATTTAYVVLFSLFAGTMLIWLGEDAPFGRLTVETALALNPMAAALSAIKAPGFTQYDLVTTNWWMMGTLTAIMLTVLLTQTWRLTRPQ